LDKVVKAVIDALAEEEVELVDPDEDPYEGEKVIGEASDVAKKLYSLAHKLHDEAYELGQKEELAEAYLKSIKSDFLKNVFWYLIHSEVEAAAGLGSIGVRTGFKIVDMSDANQVNQLMRQMSRVTEK
jgi:hypothetical protein